MCCGTLTHHVRRDTWRERRAAFAESSWHGRHVFASADGQPLTLTRPAALRGSHAHLSTLLPATTSTMSFPAIFFSSRTHFLTRLKLSVSVMSNTSSAAVCRDGT